MQRKKQKKYVYMPYGYRTKLIKALNIPESTVDFALHFRSNSETSQIIRDEAIKYYGGEIRTKR